MYFTGKLQKDGKFWMVEVPELDLATQGRSKKEALKMIADAIETLANKNGFKVIVESTGPKDFLVSSNEPARLMALFLKRQREAKNLSVREVAKAMDYTAHGAYAQYETGRSMPGIDFIDRFVKTVNPKSGLCLTIVRR
ncbi:helix-turn-helix domain-containing protein [Deltaproteobacteria bacterium PRO3]|nr:helix-turn-helix domain-containing protein [Deltaproteobacteria bacterium PRO3]